MPARRRGNLDYFFFLVFDPAVVVEDVPDVVVAVVPDVVVAVVAVVTVLDVSVMLPDGIADVLVMPVPVVSVVLIEPVVSVVAVLTVEVMAVSVVAVSVVTVSSFLHPKANIVIAASANRVIISFFIRETLLLNSCSWLTG
ncbi:MAG: hypothetical protein ACXVJO_05005 [Thermoanaerobaculia bacterium]